MLQYNMEQTHQIQEFPGFPVLLKQSLSLYKKGFRFFVPILLISLIVDLLLILIYLNNQVNTSIFAVFGLFSAPSLILSFLLALILPIAMRSITQVSMIKLLSKLNHDDPDISVSKILKDSVPYVIPLIFVNIFIKLATTVGFALLIIPGILVTIWTSLSAFTLILENQKGLKALERSRFYVKGYGGVIFLYTIGMLIFLIPIVIPGLLFPSKEFRIWLSLYGSVVSIIISPISLGFSYLIYEHLKKVKSGQQAVDK